MDHLEKTSALTGIRPEQLVAATLVQQFESAETEKKKPSPSRPPSNRQRTHLSDGIQTHPSSLQLDLPFGLGSDA
jgi:hypothetical protein